MTHNLQDSVFVMLGWVGPVITLAATDISVPKIQPRDILLRARVAAAAISRSDLKVAAFQEIASAQGRAGDRAGAIATLQGALPSVLALEANVAYDALAEIAEELARAGDISEALETAGLIPREDFQARVTGRVVAIQMEAGDTPAALQNARKTRTARVRAVLLAQVAAAQAERGYRADGIKTLQEALQTTAQIPHDWEKSEALQAIAAAQAVAGDVRASLQTAAAIQDRVRKELALGSIAATQARIKDIPGALQTAGSIQDAERKASALMAVGKIRAQGGDIQGALQIAATMQRNGAKAGILREIAAAQARAGDVQKALQTVAGIDIEQDFLKTEALREIAAIQVTAGDVQGAFNTVAMIPSGATIGGKARALREMVAAQAKRGDVAGALRTAASITRDVDFMKSWAFRDIAVAQAASGDIQGGLKTVAMIQDADIEHLIKGAAARWVTAAQARRGDVSAAIKRAENQTLPALKAFGLLGVAEGMMERQGVGKPRDNICRKALGGEWASPFIVC